MRNALESSMKKLFTIIMVLGAINSFAAPRPVKRKIIKKLPVVRAGNVKKFKALAATLVKDKTKINLICPQLCTSQAANVVPEVACGLCWKICNKAKVVAGKRNLIAEFMVKECKKPRYSSRYLIEHRPISKAQYNVMNINCQKLQKAAEFLQERLGKELVQAGDATTLIIKLQDQVADFQQGLKQQQKTYNKSLDKALDQKEQKRQKDVLALEKKFQQEFQQREKQYKAIVKEMNLLQQRSINVRRTLVTLAKPTTKHKCAADIAQYLQDTNGGITKALLAMTALNPASSDFLKDVAAIDKIVEKIITTAPQIAKDKECQEAINILQGLGRNGKPRKGVIPLKDIPAQLKKLAGDYRSKSDVQVRALFTGIHNAFLSIVDQPSLELLAEHDKALLTINDEKSVLVKQVEQLTKIATQKDREISQLESASKSQQTILVDQNSALQKQVAQLNNALAKSNQQIARLGKAPEPPVEEKLVYGQEGYEPFKAPAGKVWQWKAAPSADGKDEWEPRLVSKSVPISSGQPFQPVDMSRYLDQIQQQAFIRSLGGQQKAIPEAAVVPSSSQQATVPKVSQLPVEPKISLPEQPTAQEQSSWWERMINKINVDDLQTYEPYGYGGLGA